MAKSNKNAVRNRYAKADRRAQPLAILPKPPPGLGIFGARHWRQVGKTLVDCQILTELSLPVLAELCSWYEAARQADKKIKQYGSELFATPESRGWAMQRQRCYKNMLDLWRTFGVTASGLKQFGLHGGSGGRMDQIGISDLLKRQVENNHAETN